MIQQSLLAGAVGGLLWLDRFQLCQVMISRPIVAAPIVGWSVGDTAAGVAAGILFELLWLRIPPVGGFIAPDVTMASIATAAVAAGVRSSTDVGVTAGVFLSFLFLLPLCVVGKKVDELLRLGLGKIAGFAERDQKEGRGPRCLPPFPHGPRSGILRRFPRPGSNHRMLHRAVGTHGPGAPQIRDQISGIRILPRTAPRSRRLYAGAAGAAAQGAFRGRTPRGRGGRAGSLLVEAVRMHTPGGRVRAVIDRYAFVLPAFPCSADGGPMHQPRAAGTPSSRPASTSKRVFTVLKQFTNFRANCRTQPESFQLLPLLGFCK